MKVCWGDDEEQARTTAYRLWPNEALPGELAQVLPTTRHFEQASELVTPDMGAEQVPTFENGGLTLRLPKAETAKPKTIKINAK